MIAHKVSFDNFVDNNVALEALEKNHKMLNMAKRKIQECVDRVGLRTWDMRTQHFEMSKPLRAKCRGLSGIPDDASNAFFKAVELFTHFAPQDEWRLFDNASLPGDFIRAAEWLRSDVDWRANSLIGGLDDRFGLVERFLDRWMMNETMNGDVTIDANTARIMQQLGSWRPNIYTSDLGFGVRDYYSEESEHFAAHTGQVALGLRMLAPGGIFIAKTFTMFDEKTHGLLNTVIQQFDSFYIVKPRASKEDNSECYWVGTGYRPIAVESSTRIRYPRSVLNIATALTLRQSKKILQNVRDFQAHCRPDVSGQVDAWIRYYLK